MANSTGPSIPTDAFDDDHTTSLQSLRDMEGEICSMSDSTMAAHGIHVDRDRKTVALRREDGADMNHDSLSIRSYHVSKIVHLCMIMCLHFSPCDSPMEVTLFASHIQKRRYTAGMDDIEIACKIMGIRLLHLSHGDVIYLCRRLQVL